MTIDDFKAQLRDAAKNTQSLHADDKLDQLIMKIVEIERRHLYQLEKSSAKKRLDDIRKLLDESLPIAKG